MTSVSTNLAINEQIDEMVKRIVQRFDPKKIILFGSQARGDANKDSDVDLLVIMEFDGLKREKQVEIGLELYDIDVPIDVIVHTPREFICYQTIAGTIPRIAVKEGKILYAKEQ
ncbi:MAG: nucleotidyltransferase domain-containing protein [Candidatus Omnitrophota bacterium]|jgi:predicted nucleotidyltransferase|nr:MAG: nucleotidyltransferase domain-containing protein [Candidatus Omnitrophota bacterium]